MRLLVRRLATSSGFAPPQTAPIVFDTSVKARQKERAASNKDAREFDYLRDEVAARVVDRVCDVARSFPHALDMYCGSGHVLRALRIEGNKPGIRSLILADLHQATLDHATVATAVDSSALGVDTSQQFVLREEGEAPLPVADGSLDLVMSSCGLHWVNDLPGVLARANRLLRPDGLFIGAMYGGDTLRELRIAMQLAEEEVRGGVSPHVSPMVQLRDVGSVLGRAGFRLTTVDLDTIVVPFRDMRAIMRHLKGMGENNAVYARRAHYGRATFKRAAAIYEERFGYVDDQGRPCVPATFQIVHMIGWAPADASVQPTPRARGSATASFTDLSRIAGEETKRDD
jgi:NADH dehydrogenase [ubiquinone] 1 alpha subcomplex assembly factor 5